MKLYRVITYARSNMEVVVAEQAGELVRMDHDRSFKVRDESGYYLPYGGDWRETRAQALLAAALDIEKAARAMEAQARELREQLAQEGSRAAPGPDSGSGKPQGERRGRSRHNTRRTTSEGHTSAKAG